MSLWDADFNMYYFFKVDKLLFGIKLSYYASVPD